MIVTMIMPAAKLAITATSDTANNTNGEWSARNSSLSRGSAWNFSSRFTLSRMRQVSRFCQGVKRAGHSEADGLDISTTGGNGG